MLKRDIPYQQFIVTKQMVITVGLCIAWLAVALHMPTSSG